MSSPYPRINPSLTQILPWAARIHKDGLITYVPLSNLYMRDELIVYVPVSSLDMRISLSLMFPWVLIRKDEWITYVPMSSSYISMNWSFTFPRIWGWINHLRSGEELVHEDAHGPVVDGPVVPLVEDDLRSHVLRGPAEGPRLTTRIHVLWETEIHQLDVALSICMNTKEQNFNWNSN